MTPLEEKFTQKGENVLTLRPSKIRMSVFLHQIWRNVALHQCLSNGSEWVPSEWESDKNITIIHSTPVHQLTSGEEKTWNKSSINIFLYESIIHNGVDYCDAFINSLDSQSDGTHSLQSLISVWLINMHHINFIILCLC